MFKVFAPEIISGVASKVACYVYHGFLQTDPILPVFCDCSPWIAVDLHRQSGLIDLNHPGLRLYNGYSTNSTSSVVQTIFSENRFHDQNLPLVTSIFAIPDQTP